MSSLRIRRMFALALAASSLLALALSPARLSGSGRVGQQVEEPTATPSTSGRPRIVLSSYGTGKENVRPGTKFSLKFTLANVGSAPAEEVIVTFLAGDFLPRENGGVVVVGAMPAGGSSSYAQPLIASPALMGGSVGSATMTISYGGADGEEYSGQFQISVAVGEEKKPAAGPYPTATPTPTPTYRPQLLIEGYRADREILSPGTSFNLELEVLNVGGSEARNITMIMGGGMGAKSSGDDSGGDGVSGAGGDFSVFAPLNTSNIQFLGDIDVQGRRKEKIHLIVNTTAKPGAYALRFSFSYADAKGKGFLDDQVITLLVLSQPRLDISFYRPPDPLFSGQGGTIPLQIINLSPNNVALGVMSVRTAVAQISGGESTVGLLEAGGFYTLDVMLVPEAPGPLNLQVEVQYYDDFNQPQAIQREFDLEVMQGVPVEPIPETGGEGPPAAPEPEGSETFWQSVLRVVRGLLGLDSHATPSVGRTLKGEVA